MTTKDLREQIELMKNENRNLNDEIDMIKCISAKLSKQLTEKQTKAQDLQSLAEEEKQLQSKLAVMDKKAESLLTFVEDIESKGAFDDDKTEEIYSKKEQVQNRLILSIKEDIREVKEQLEKLAE